MEPASGPGATLRAVRQEHTLLEDGLPAGHSRCDTRAQGAGLALAFEGSVGLPRPNRIVAGEASLDADGPLVARAPRAGWPGAAARRAAGRPARRRGRARARRGHRAAPHPRRPAARARSSGRGRARAHRPQRAPARGHAASGSAAATGGCCSRASPPASPSARTAQSRASRRPPCSSSERARARLAARAVQRRRTVRSCWPGWARASSPPSTS